MPNFENIFEKNKKNHSLIDSTEKLDQDQSG